MAIIKSITTADTIEHPNAYWNIKKREISKENGDYIYTINMQGWHSQAARIAEANPVVGAVVRIINPELSEADDIDEILYPLIKLDSQFEGATDSE